MIKSTLLISIILILFFLTSCRSINNISGSYYTNFAAHGFFATRISLNIDSTFTYRMRGDMMFDTSHGHYKIKSNYVVLYHEPLKPDTSDLKGNGVEAVLLGFAHSTNKHLCGPEKYIIGYKKLFFCDSTGKAIRKEFGYSKRRQYLFFGKHWYNRRYYLKRIA